MQSLPIHHEKTIQRLSQRGMCKDAVANNGIRQLQSKQRGGPNGIRTRVYGPPRAFLDVSGNYVLLTQHPVPRDLNSAGIFVATRTSHKAAPAGRRRENRGPASAESHAMRLRWKVTGTSGQHS